MNTKDEFEINKLFNLLRSNQQNLQNVQFKFDCGIINISEAEAQNEILRTEQLHIREELARYYHVGKNGKPLQIPTRKNYKNNTMFRIKFPDGTFAYAPCYSELIDKILEHYCYNSANYTFEAVWKEAYDSYERKHPDKDKTLISKRADYARFVNSTLAEMDIRDITADYLEEYSIKLIKDNSLIETAFKAFKGVINLVYDYAIRNEKYEIIKNPGKAMDNNNCFSYCKNTTSSRKAKDVMYTTKQMDTIISTFKSRVNYKPYNGYYIPYFAARLQRATGERPGELFALKWSDIVQTENGALLSITRSQIEHRYLNGKKQQWYEIIESTKDEKGVSKGGREFPITNEINEILMDIRNAQMKNNIHSEYIICDRNGEMCKKKVYFDAFTSVCKSLGYPLLGSYTFRRELNSKLERAGLESSDRAALLGHSVQTNEKWYTFAEHGVVDRGRQALNETASESSKSVENVTYHTKIVSFGERRKARNPIVSGISY